ncbi:MAG: type II toxin-antitoxin system PemK/MazF family toxin [Treponema sp.]|nr:type II toxin-antitoxin system PemK/MazF family toxin [Treponema sp.]
MTHGEIWTIDFGVPVGSLPSKIRPAVVMQNDLLGIKELNTAVVIPFTSNLDRAESEPNILLEFHCLLFNVKRYCLIKRKCRVRMS